MPREFSRLQQALALVDTDSVPDPVLGSSAACGRGLEPQLEAQRRTSWLSC
jgi:hypothetical protein